jgi:cell pole-organizing protein PopZ
LFALSDSSLVWGEGPLAQSSAKVQDPSMEEILASIRRIISDENAVAEAGLKPTHAPLREVKAEPPASAEGPINKDAVDALLSYEDAASQTSRRSSNCRNGRNRRAPPGASSMPLTWCSAITSRSARPEPAERPVEPRYPAVPASKPSSRKNQCGRPFDRLQYLSRELPLGRGSGAGDAAAHAKHWLDDNLPGLVERMVRTEIERVSRGGR